MAHSLSFTFGNLHILIFVSHISLTAPKTLYFIDIHYDSFIFLLIQHEPWVVSPSSFSFLDSKFENLVVQNYAGDRKEWTGHERRTVTQLISSLLHPGKPQRVFSRKHWIVIGRVTSMWAVYIPADENNAVRSVVSLASTGSHLWLNPCSSQHESACFLSWFHSNQLPSSNFCFTVIIFLNFF